MATQPILMIGGTRGTGLLIARRLQERGESLRVFARNPSGAKKRYNGNVEVVPGDLTRPETLSTAVNRVRHVIFTAGIRSGYPASEARTKAVDYEGMRHTLTALRASGFAGRFLYMTSSGGEVPSFGARCLNIWKGNTLVWRRRAEDEIRRSGLSYTIVRAGVLVNAPGGKHLLSITQQPLPLAWRYRIAREDVAALFVAALEHPQSSRVTFEAVWGRPGQPQSFETLLNGLHPDR